ncbi:hypothetical protein BJP62_06260 [Jeongeupia sp. USM3]|nr:hypothetical protein BJP62_06260 [Jeongeupia sp. USM3]
MAALALIALGGVLNGWRLTAAYAGELADLNSTIAQQATELAALRTSVAALDVAASEAAARRERAEREAETLRAQAKRKASWVASLNASSCDDVLRQSWGRL